MRWLLTILLFTSLGGYSQVMISQTRVINLIPDLENKEPIITAPNSIKRYWNGYKQFVSFNSDSIPEGSTNFYYTNAHGLGTVLTGYVSGAGTVSSADNILQAIQKLNGNIALKAALATANTFTTNGALSAPAQTFNGTWITGGTTTTTKPYFLIETSGATSGLWVTTGTGLGVNAASGFTGNLADFKLDGATKFSISSAGVLTTPSLLTAAGGIRANAAVALPVGHPSTTNFSTASTFQIDMSAGTMTMTSGTNGGVYIHPTYNQASGSGTNADLRINRTETAVMSGAQYLIQAQVAGTDKFTVSPTGKVTVGATTTASASLNIPVGTAPSSPVDGDVWREDNTNTGLKIRVNGVTKTISLL